MIAAAVVRRATRRVDLTSDAGQMGGVEVLPFGILILVTGSLMVVNLWSVINTKMAVNAAAREAAHAVAEAAPTGNGSGDLSADARREGERAAIAALTTHFDRSPDQPVAVEIVFPPGGWRRCARIDVRVTYRAPVIALPFLGSMGPDRDVVAEHHSIVDPYRDSAPVPAGSDTGALGPCR